MYLNEDQEAARMMDQAHADGCAKTFSWFVVVLLTIIGCGIYNCSEAQVKGNATKLRQEKITNLGTPTDCSNDGTFHGTFTSTNSASTGKGTRYINYSPTIIDAVTTKSNPITIIGVHVCLSISLKSMPEKTDTISYLRGLIIGQFYDKEFFDRSVRCRTIGDKKVFEVLVGNKEYTFEQFEKLIWP